MATVPGGGGSSRKAVTTPKPVRTSGGLPLGGLVGDNRSSGGTMKATNTNTTVGKSPVKPVYPAGRGQTVKPLTPKPAPVMKVKVMSMPRKPVVNTFRGGKPSGGM